MELVIYFIVRTSLIHFLIHLSSFVRSNQRHQIFINSQRFYIFMPLKHLRGCVKVSLM
jgi:hypothetical protein